MLPLNVIFAVSISNVKTRDVSPQAPPWLDNYNKSNWWYLAGADNFYTYSKVEDTIYMQYGENKSGWATNRFFAQSFEVVSEILNADNSITATVIIYPLFLVARRTDYFIAGVSSHSTIKINGTTVYEHTGTSGDEYTLGAKSPVTVTVTVPPESQSFATAMEFIQVYPNGEYPNTQTYAGITLYNPNRAQYIPMSIRKSNTWKPLEGNRGFIEIRKSNQWLDKSFENSNTSLQVNQGHNQIRISNEWKQLPKMI